MQAFLSPVELIAGRWVFIVSLIEALCLSPAMYVSLGSKELSTTSKKISAVSRDFELVREVEKCCGDPSFR